MEGCITDKDRVELGNKGLELDDQTLSIPFYDEILIAKKLFNYFEMLINDGILNIDLTEESAFTLEQFFTDEFLCVEGITGILENTNFEAEYENVRTKVKGLLAKGLIVKKEKNFTRKYPRRRNTVNYQLTSLGIFCLFTKVEKDLSRNIFQDYENDILFEIFLYPIINRESIASLASAKVKFIYKLCNTDLLCNL